MDSALPTFAPARHPLARVAMLALGFSFFGLGAVGVLLPVLPTTPFMILALWAFSRSSRRFQVWLYTHRVWGPPLRRWHLHGVIPPVVKVVAVGGMTASFMWLALGVGAGVHVLAPVGLVMLGGSAFILRCPSRPPVVG